VPSCSPTFTRETLLSVTMTSGLVAVEKPASATITL
jgi:hypothetical protein